VLNGARPTLLVVEDEEVIGLSLQASLDEAGFAVQLFPDATAVLACIDRIAIAAAIIDVGLPGMRGDDLARLCRARLPALPIILATGYDEVRYASSVAADPLLAVLEKPFDTPRLLIRLESFGVYAAA
jgi:two-component system, NtrC family, C4-dicarboxylate transport response regulator DctD